MPIVNLISNQGNRIYQAEISLYAIPGVLLQNYSNRVEFKPVKNLSKILHEVCNYLGVDLMAAVSQNRKRENVQARQLYCYIAVNTTGESLVKIGQVIGDRDHTTVIHSHRLVEDMLATREPIFVDCITAIAPYLMEVTPRRNRLKKDKV
jgi:chromosomal replication initiation ATPase DnaA